MAQSPVAPPQKTVDLILKPTDKLHDRFTPQEMIGQGGFGQIFKGIDSKTKKTVAIKVEHKAPATTNPTEQMLNDPRRLIIEHDVLVGLRGKKHIPLIFATGTTKRGNPFIIMQILGENLTTLRKQRKEAKFSFSTSFRIGQQITFGLEFLHELGYIHRDIKPSNCCIGFEDRKVIYLLDFGMCRKWIVDGKPRPARDHAPFKGTLRYASLRAMNQKECGPVDDLIGWLYSILELFLGHIPWAKITDIPEIIRLKTETKLEDLCKTTPESFKECCNYVFPLEYSVMPDYPKVHKLLRKCFPENFDFSEPFDWDAK